MKRIFGTETHRSSGRQVEFSVEYNLSIAGVTYYAVLTAEGCRPSRSSGFMVWALRFIPPSRTLEKTVRESVQFLDIAKLCD
jgi:hypothetical protein